MKITLLALAIIGLMTRGYFMYQARQAEMAKQALSSRSTIDQLRRNMRGADAEAEAEAQGKPVTASRPSAAPAASTTPATAGNNNGSAEAAQAAQRQEIEASLKAMRLTTIMPGQPGLVIIDKEEYGEGEELPVGKGRKAKIVAVRDDGVQLTCNGMAFHMDPPAAPDLAASRKKK